MTKRAYAIYDVFTSERLAGNPLAIVFDSAGLDDGAMQAIAREFNLSETVFILPPERAAHTSRIRIFTPDYEMPFAGHPTVGTAIALAGPTDAANDTGDARIVVLEENIGPVRCMVSKSDGGAFAEFDLPRLPAEVPLSASREAIAAALGLDHHQVGFENHVVGCWSAGVAYVCVPLSGLDAMAEAQLDPAAWNALAPRREKGEVACAYLYCRETVMHDSDFHARMLVPGPPGWEDPATGSAAAAFAGAVARHDRPVDGGTALWIEQGMEMGRPSRIRLEIEMDGGAITAARIGGNAVRVAEGSIEV